MHAATDKLFHSLRRLLNALHAEKKAKGVDEMLLRLYAPILWRSLEVANAVVRRHAATLLVDAFPLVDTDDSAEASSARPPARRPCARPGGPASLLARIPERRPRCALRASVAQALRRSRGGGAHPALPDALEGRTAVPCVAVCDRPFAGYGRRCDQAVPVPADAAARPLPRGARGGRAGRVQGAVRVRPRSNLLLPSLGTAPKA